MTNKTRYVHTLFGGLVVVLEHNADTNEIDMVGVGNSYESATRVDSDGEFQFHSFEINEITKNITMINEVYK